MRILQFILISLFACFALSCSSKRVEPIAESSLYCEDSAMAHFLTHPERSLVLLDSAVIVNTLSPVRAEYLKAIVVYNGMDKADSSIAICQRLIEDKAWSDIDDPEERVSCQVDIYRLMATINSSSGNPLTVIRYATEGIKLTHGVEMYRGDETDFLSRMGFVMCEIGQIDEGLNAMKRAEELSSTDHSWSSLLAYLNNCKKLYASLERQNRHDEAETEVMKAIIRLEEFRQNPQAISNIPEAMLEDSDALTEFLNYSLTPLYSYMTYLCHKAGNVEEAQKWLDQFNAIKDPTVPTAAMSIIHPLIEMGRYDEARQYIESARDYATVGPEYISLLKEDMFLNQELAQFETSTAIANQIIAYTDSLNLSKYQILLAEAATQYQLQDERLRREESEAKVVIWTIVALLAILVIILLVGVYYFRIVYVHRKLLKAQLSEAEIEIENLKADQNHQGEERIKSISYDEILKRATFIMNRYQYFKDPKFDIEALSQLVFTNRTYVSTAINKTGQNFRSWLAAYRIDYAKKLMLADPELTIESVMTSCGIDNRANFYRWFKNLEGMTPNEWLEKNSEAST